MHRTKTGKTISGLGALLFSLTLILLSFSACQSTVLYQQQFLQFGTVIDVTLISTDERLAITIFDDIERLLKTRHSEWHGWQGGVLTKFNKDLPSQPGKGITIPETLILLIQQSKKYYAITQGLFNPALGRLISAWGFHQHTEPDYELIKKIQKDIPGMHDLIIENNRAHSKNPFLQLDFGAIAKGLAVKQIADLLNKNHIQHFIINAGGDIFAQGQKQGKNWRIAIENPFSTGIVATLQVHTDSSIFTSGNYRRFYQDENNKRRHHIIDPNSGSPSAKIRAASVIHSNPVLADIAATTLMLTGIEQLKSMVNKLGIQDFMVISEQKEVYISASMLKKIHWINPQQFIIHEL